MPIGASDFLLDGPDHLHALAHRSMIAMTHVDAEEIGAGTIKIDHRLLIDAGRSEGRDDFAAAQPSHA